MKIEDLLIYICAKYPIPQELSKARLTKIVYLADWEACLRTGAQLTPIRWYFHNFGPYVDDVLDAAKRSPLLEVVETENLYGEPKQLIRIHAAAASPQIDRMAQSILDHVISETKSLYWNEFIRYVYATKPIADSTRYTELDLPRFAKQVR